MLQELDWSVNLLCVGSVILIVFVFETGMMYRPSAPGTQPQMLLPATYQIAGSQIYQVGIRTLLSLQWFYVLPHYVMVMVKL